MVKLSTAQARKALEHLPKGVDDSYDKAMDRIDQQDEDRKQLAKQVFSWITHTFRPLYLEELQHAMAVEFGATEIDREAIIDEDILIAVCAGLVVIDDESRLVRLVRR